MSCSYLKLHQTLEGKNIFKQENIMLQLTFNPGLTLTGFRTTRPCSHIPKQLDTLELSKSLIIHQRHKMPLSLVSLQIFSRSLTMISFSVFLGAMDSFARGLKNAAKLIEDGTLDSLVKVSLKFLSSFCVILS